VLISFLQLDRIFKSLIFTDKYLDVENGEKIMSFVLERAKVFANEDIYRIALCFNPAFKIVSQSFKDPLSSSEDMMPLIKRFYDRTQWKLFSKKEAELFIKELGIYMLKDFTDKFFSNVLDFWKRNEDFPYLKKFVLTILTIRTHTALVESLFSSLKITKTSIRNQMHIETLQEHGILQTELRKEIIQRKNASFTFVQPTEINEEAGNEDEYFPSDLSESEADSDFFATETNKTTSTAEPSSINTNSNLTNSNSSSSSLSRIAKRVEINWDEINSKGMGELCNTKLFNEIMKKIETKKNEKDSQDSSPDEYDFQMADL